MNELKADWDEVIMPHDFGKGKKTIISNAYVFLVVISDHWLKKIEEEERENAHKLKSSFHK